VRLAAPESVAIHIGIAVPELMVIPLPETKAGTAAKDSLDILKDHFKVCQAAVIGPGIDEESHTLKLAEELYANLALPLVVDAQALAAVSAKAKPEGPRILTPHLQEFEAVLLGKSVEDNEEAVEAAATAFAAKTDATLVLKRRHTLIVPPAGETLRNEAGNRVLATAGSGDVLAGVIGSLLAQGLEPTAAAAWGVHMHALAGDAVAKDGAEDGILARDFIDQLPSVQKYLRRSAAPKDRGRVGLRPN
jgi:NAD(P)H-hydrate epimerase